MQHEERSDTAVAATAGDYPGLIVALAWLAVGVPFLIGLYIALSKAAPLF